MRFKTWFETYEQEATKILAQYEAAALANPQVKAELQTKGEISIRVLQQALGLDEGTASFLSRELNKRHSNQTQIAAFSRQRDEALKRELVDEYYYHVTLKQNVRKIKREGLNPNSKPVFSNYADYSAGKIFLCEKGAVGYWKWRVEDHVFVNTEKELPLVVFRVKKEHVPNIAPDQRGTDDSKHGSYCTTEVIPPQFLELTAL
jgi:hypothetical protein